MRSLLSLFAVSFLLAADEPKQELVPHELLGVWEGRKAETFGNSSGLQSVKWEFRGDKIIYTRISRVTDGTRGDRVTEIKYRLDDAKTPKEIDITNLSGPLAGKVQKGIYKIENNTLTICHVRSNIEGAKTDERPTEFDAQKRNDLVILTFERKKP